jgi:hypothetical protein
MTDPPSLASVERATSGGGPPSPTNPPPVLLWQKVYCFAMAALYALIAVLGLAMAVFRDQLADEQTPPGEVVVIGLVFVALGVGLAAPFAVAPFLPRRRWVWVLHLVIIAVGMTSCLCIPFAVPLLVFWIRPATQAWFGWKDVEAMR